LFFADYSIVGKWGHVLFPFIRRPASPLPRLKVAVAWSNSCCQERVVKSLTTHSGLRSRPSRCLPSTFSAVGRQTCPVSARQLCWMSDR